MNIHSYETAMSLVASIATNDIMKIKAAMAPEESKAKMLIKNSTEYDYAELKFNNFMTYALPAIAQALDCYYRKANGSTIDTFTEKEIVETVGCCRYDIDHILTFKWFLPHAQSYTKSLTETILKLWFEAYYDDSIRYEKDIKSY